MTTGPRRASMLARLATSNQRTHQILELPPRLLHNAVLAAKDNAHARQIPDLRAAHDKRVDVEPSAGQNARHAREHTRLVLH